MGRGGNALNDYGRNSMNRCELTLCRASLLLASLAVFSGIGLAFQEGRGGEVPKFLENFSVEDLFRNEIVAKVNRDLITRQEIEEALRPALKTMGNPSPDAILDLKMRELLRIVGEKIEDGAVTRYNFVVRQRDVETQIEERMKEAGSEDAFRSALAERGVTLDEFEENLEKELARVHFLRTQLGLRAARKVNQRTRYDLEVSPDEIRSFYEENLEQYRVKPRSRVRRIYISSKKLGGDDQGREEARKILNECRSGGSFEEMAKQRSHGKYRETGGDLGWIEKEDKSHLQSIVDFAFSAKVGEISGIKKVGRGYFILYLESSEPGTLRPFALVQDEIRARLWDQKAGEILLSIRRELIEESYIDPPEVKMLLLFHLDRSR